MNIRRNWTRLQGTLDVIERLRGTLDVIELDLKGH